MVNVFPSSAVDHGFEHRLDQTKDYKLVFVAKHAALRLRKKSEDWLAWNQDNVSEWGDIYHAGSKVSDKRVLVGSVLLLVLASVLCFVFFCFVCLRPVSCVLGVASFSGLSILDCPIGFL